MVTCQVCGGESFEKHAGYMYCVTCQTQSQDYHDQEGQFEPTEYERHTVPKVSKTRSKQKSTKSCDEEGDWTSWEAFNYILYGMTQELKVCGVTQDFETIVLKLWASYLKTCGIAFISRHNENLPKLGFFFKQRDARVLYNVDVSSAYCRRKKKRFSSKASNTSNSSISSFSKRSLALKKSNIIASDYEEHLSSSFLSRSSLANETLESLGKSSESEIGEGSSDLSKSICRSMKSMLNKEDFKLYKSAQSSASLMLNAKEKSKRSVKFPSKNKLLAILHLASLMTGCEIQLSDFLRFIREGHLSYAKVTHFLPKDFKFSKNDFSYIDAVSDLLMPTHLKQRKITSALAYLLKIEQIPTPNMTLLVDRYCTDLNLPEQICKYSVHILASHTPTTTVPRAKLKLPSYEAWAMASIIFVLKLLFGLNDAREMFLSTVARKINSLQQNSNEAKLFVFNDWQKFIECRKTILIDFHYPTQEQLNGDAVQSSKMFLDMLMKESKDEHRADRFMAYNKYYMDGNLISGIKQMLSELTSTHRLQADNFKPSLTPLSSHLETIRQNLSEETTDRTDDRDSFRKPVNLPENILSQTFKKCDTQFIFEINKYLNVLKENESEWPDDFNIDVDPSSDHDLFSNHISRYWVLPYPSTRSVQLSNFKEEVFEKTSENFQWLMTECSRMLEMNVRDLYDELRCLENRYSTLSTDSSESD